MKHLVTLMLALFCMAAAATQQSPEILISASGTRAMQSDPLATAKDTAPELWARFSKLFSPARCSALWRGYIGTWAITDGELQLVSVRSSDCRTQKDIPLSDIVPNQVGPITARWFSGELFFEVGPYVPGPCGFSPTCPSAYDVLIVERGKVVRSERRQSNR